MAQRGRPKVLPDPVPILVRVESWERELRQELADSKTLTEEVRDALRAWRTGGGLDDHLAVNGGAPRSR